MKEMFDIMMKRIPGFSQAAYQSDWKWVVLKELYQKNYHSTNAGQRSIPKIIHQIWLGGKVPSRYIFWMNSWKEKHPDYVYYLWTDSNVEELLSGKTLELFHSMRNNGPKSDLIRYIVLEKFGGIYIDTDFECLKSFEELSYLDFYTGIGYPSSVELYPGLIACIPHHPIIKRIVEEISKLTWTEISINGVLETTSSYFFTRVFFDEVKEYRSGVVAFPPDYFYPFPNYKGHENEEGSKYILPCSFAIHYWEVSWSPSKGKVDWIQGDKFVRVADTIYSPRNKAQDDYALYQNTFDPSSLKSINFVYTCSMYLGRLLRIVESLPAEFIIISHNGDQHIEQEKISTFSGGKRVGEEFYRLSDNVRMLYSVNVDVKVHDPKISPIPIGLENSMWGMQKKDKMISLIKNPSSKNELVYMNHAINTNPIERKIPYGLFEEEAWVTKGINRGTHKGYEEYLEAIASHKFTICPTGNGIDTHRIWEALYLNCIPIVKRDSIHIEFANLPILIIDSWEQLSEQFLQEEYDRIHDMEWDKDLLRFGYWRNKIRAIK